MQQTCEKNAGLRHRSRVRILNASSLKVKPPPPGHNCISFTWPVVYASNKSGGERRLHYIRALTCRNCLFFFFSSCRVRSRLGRSSIGPDLQVELLPCAASSTRTWVNQRVSLVQRLGCMQDYHLFMLWATWNIFLLAGIAMSS